MLDPQTWTREALERHSVDMRQFIDFRQSTLPNGMRIVDAYNTSGLNFSVLPDRGMDIWTAHYKGIPLTWISQGSPHLPDAGQTWLEQFNGGLLTTCGLTHVGPPEVDEKTGQKRDLHGNYTRLRAFNVALEGARWEEYAPDSYELTLTGELAESALFGTQIYVHRSISMEIDRPVITISDSFHNRSDAPTPFMLLYHFNVGYPLIGDGATLHVPSHTIFPRDNTAAGGAGQWQTYKGGTKGYREQVFFHHLKTKDKKQTRSEALIVRGELGLRFEWDTRTLPYLTQWKNVRQGIYVCGIEPGNCIPEGQNAAHHNQRLYKLEPDEKYATTCRLEVLEGQTAIDAAIARINQLNETGVPVTNCNLESFVV